jgi:hypothetical protein
MMQTDTVKNHIKQLVDDCADEALLRQTEELLSGNWQSNFKLPPAELERTQSAHAELMSGGGLDHQDVMQMAKRLVQNAGQKH